MKRAPILPFLCVSALAFLLISCSTGNKFASSFGKRKYTKGYYVDRISHPQKPVTTVGTRHQTQPTACPQKPATSIKTVATTHTICLTEIPAPAKPSFTHSLKAASVHIYHPQKAIAANDTTLIDGASQEGETNYFAISGFVLSTVGVVMCIANGFFTIGAIILLIVGCALCIYSLCLDKIYWTWLGIVGLAFVLFLFILILV